MSWLNPKKKNGITSNITETLPKIEEGDFYVENGFFVFTEQYHLKRGICCGSNCRHCPFDHQNVKSDLNNIEKKN
jgi:hypothetical protein